MLAAYCTLCYRDPDPNRNPSPYLKCGVVHVNFLLWAVIMSFLEHGYWGLSPRGSIAKSVKNKQLHLLNYTIATRFYRASHVWIYVFSCAYSTFNSIQPKHVKTYKTTKFSFFSVPSIHVLGEKIPCKSLVMTRQL